MLRLSLYLLWFQQVCSLKCAQCNGWDGKYPGREGATTCDNLNNLCDGAEFCVKIVDPIAKGRGYHTFKSDCFYSSSTMTGLNTSTIKSGKCYPFKDGGSPERQYTYCFCNDHDYCNNSYRFFNSALVIISVCYVLIRNWLS